MAKETETAELLHIKSLEEPSLRRNQFLYLKLATLFYVLGVITTFDLYVDRMNYLPDAVSALFFCGCGYCLSRLLHGRRSNWILPLVWGAVSLVHTGLSVRFFREYTIAAIERMQAAERAYRLVLVSAAASEALMAGVVILMFFSFRTVVRRYTGIPGADVRYTKTEMATRRELTVKSLWVAVLGCLTAAVSFCYEVTLATTVDVATDTTYTSGRLTIPYLDWFWIVVWVAGGIWLILSLHTSGRLREEAEMNLLDA